jgi:hypothetical protein
MCRAFLATRGGNIGSAAKLAPQHSPISRVAATARTELDTLPADAQLIVQMVIANTGKTGPKLGRINSLHPENNSLFGENNSLLAPEKFPEAPPPLV